MIEEILHSHQHGLLYSLSSKSSTEARRPLAITRGHVEELVGNPSSGGGNVNQERLSVDFRSNK